MPLYDPFSKQESVQFLQTINQIILLPASNPPGTSYHTENNIELFPKATRAPHTLEPSISDLIPLLTIF